MQDGAELLDRGGGESDLVGDSTQEGGVHQIAGSEIGAKQYQRIEGNRERCACVQLQIVDVLFQRDHPAVQQILWLHDLPAEIVDHEGSADRLDMQGRLVEIRFFNIAQF